MLHSVGVTELTHRVGSLLNLIQTLQKNRVMSTTRRRDAIHEDRHRMVICRRARIAQLEAQLKEMQHLIDQAHATEVELRRDNARLRNEVLRVSLLNRMVESESESEPDSDYEPESDVESEPEYKPVIDRPWIQDVYADIENNGCRAQRFAKILRTIMPFPNTDINEVYNEVLNTDRYSGAMQKKDIHPNFWTALGRNEDEKIVNAKKVIELLYNRLAANEV